MENMMTKQEQIDRNRKEFNETGKLPDYLLNVVKSNEKKERKFTSTVRDITPEGYGPQG